MKKYFLGVLFAVWGVANAATAQKPMVIVVPSYNNAQYYQANLDSIFSQQYDNYRVIYVNDASTDGTGELVAQYIEEHGLEDKITLINNESNHGGLYNLYHMIHSCDDEEIVVEVDGDDRLANDLVLPYLSELYEDPNIWLTYGQYKNEPKEAVHAFGLPEIGYARQVSARLIKRNNYRRIWVFMALRTFYAGLFKRIIKQDLLCDKSVPEFVGKFFPESWDLAMMYPMLEMSGGRFKFCSEILYLRNVDNPLNAFKSKSRLQQRLSRGIRRRRKYTPLSEKPF